MVDPVTLGALGTTVAGLFGGTVTGTAATALGAGVAGVGALGGAAALSAIDKSGGSSTTVNMPASAPPVQNPVGSQTSNTSSGVSPSFLAAAATPQANQTAGTRSLLVQ